MKVFPGSFQNLFFNSYFIYGKAGYCLAFGDSEILDVGGEQQESKLPWNYSEFLNVPGMTAVRHLCFWKSWDLGVFIRHNFLWHSFSIWFASQVSMPGFFQFACHSQSCACQYNHCIKVMRDDD